MPVVGWWLDDLGHPHSHIWQLAGCWPERQGQMGHMSLIIQQASPEFLTRGQVPKQEERADKLQSAFFKLRLGPPLLLFHCPKQIKHWNPDTRCREPDFHLGRAAECCGYSGKNLWPFLQSMQGAHFNGDVSHCHHHPAENNHDTAFQNSDVPLTNVLLKALVKKMSCRPPPQGSLLGAR